MFNNKKGIAPIMIALIIAGVLLSFYIVLYIPIPAFKQLRMTLNYYFIVLILVAVQIAILYAYFSAIKYCVQGYSKIKNKLKNLDKITKNFVKKLI